MNAQFECKISDFISGKGSIIVKGIQECLHKLGYACKVGYKHEYNYDLCNNKAVFDIESDEEMITISKNKYEELQKESAWLNSLVNAGVDNWEGYDVAIDIYDELYKNDYGDR